MLILQTCWRVRLVAQCSQTWRTFSSLQAKNGFSLNRQWKPKCNKIFVRCKVLTTTKPRRFRPQYSKDKVSREFDLVYENNMNRLLFWSQLFMYGITIPTVIGSAWIVASHLEDIPSNLSLGHPATTALSYVVFGTTLIVFVNMVCRRSIRRIYFEPNSSKYIAVVQNWMMVPNKIEFQMKDTKSFHKPKLGNLAIKDRVFFVVGTDFTVPVHYNNLMGFDSDRPVDVVKELDVYDFVKKKKMGKPKSEN